MKKIDIIFEGIKNQLINENLVTGIQVQHKKFGIGVIQEVKTDTLTISFNKFGVKNISIYKYNNYNSRFFIDENIPNIKLNSIKQTLFEQRMLDPYLKEKYKISKPDENTLSILYRIEENKYQSILTENFSVLNKKSWDTLIQSDQRFLDEEALRKQKLFQVLAIWYNERFENSDVQDYWLLINSALYWKDKKEFSNAIELLKKVDSILDSLNNKNRISKYKYHKDKSTVFTIMASNYSKQFDYKSALDYGEKAINYNPDSPFAHNTYASACKDLGMYTAARKHIDIANKL